MPQLFFYKHSLFIGLTQRSLKAQTTVNLAIKSPTESRLPQTLVQELH